MSEKCTAYLTVAGRDYECDRDDPPHRGLAHSNKEAEALWVSHDERQWIHRMQWAAGVVGIDE